MHALITGGAGFIGSRLSEYLLERGHNVTIIDDLSTGRMDNIVHLRGHDHFRFAIETIRNDLVLDRLVSECDMVYHLAASVGVELIIRSPVDVIETNILGTDAVLRAANRYKKRVFLASTSEVYGKSSKVPFSEDDDSILGPTVKSRWCYACSKAIDEFLGLAYYREKGLEIVIARLFNTVGPRQTGQYGMVVPRFVQRAIKGEPLTVYGDGLQSRCFAYVGDVVDGIVKIATAAGTAGQVFNLGSTDEVSILDLAKKTIERSRSHSEIQFVAYDEAYNYGFEDMRRRIPDITKAKKFGFSPTVGLEAILDKVIEFERARKAAK